MICLQLVQKQTLASVGVAPANQGVRASAHAASTPVLGPHATESTGWIKAMETVRVRVALHSWHMS